MGVKQIWDGKDLPPIGCQVLIKLASAGIKAYEVAGYGIRPPSASREPSIPEYYSIVVIKVKSLDGNAVNERFLSEVFPLDYREEAL